MKIQIFESAVTFAVTCLLTHDRKIEARFIGVNKTVDRVISIAATLALNG